MNTPSVALTSPFLARGPNLSRGFSALRLVAVLGVFSAALPAQDAAADPDGQRVRRRDQAPKENGERRPQSPEDMQARVMTQMRERFDVPDDEEWNLISARLAKVMELRRAAAGGLGGLVGFTGRGPQPGGGNADPRASRGGRGAPGGNTEVAALSAALRDKLPDAEVKARLDRVRESRKDSEAKLVKAQEELRAVLSVRQEAQAVVFGLLP